MAVGSLAEEGAPAPVGSFVRRHRRLLFALLVLALGLGQMGAWREYARREVTSGYPTGGDQVQYGLQAFHLCQSILDRGVVPSVRAYLTKHNPTGSLLQLQGGTWCAKVASGWLDLLTVNFLYFLFLQAVTAWVAWRVGGRRRRWAVMATGLTLTLGTPHFQNGGLMDFRLDFAAFCLYGTFIALVIRSGVFASRGFSLLAAVVGGLLVWLRTFTLTYLLGVGAILAVYFFLTRGSRSPGQLVNLGLSLCVVAGVAVPILIFQFGALYDYYWVGHVVGVEPRARAREMGITGLFGHLTFYPKMLVTSHLKMTFLGVAGFVLLAAAVLRRRRPRETEPDGDAPWSLRDRLVFCAACVVVPLAVLMSDEAKSPIVVGITAQAVLWLVLLTAMGLAGPRLLDGRAGAVIACVVLAAGLVSTGTRLTRPILPRAERPGIVQVLDVYERMWSATAGVGSKIPLGFSVFSIREYLWPQMGDFLAFDRHRQFANLYGELGYTIFATNLHDARSKIDRSFFVVTAAQRPERELFLPFDLTIQPLIPELTRYVRERFVHVLDFEVRGLRHGLYRRPLPRLIGVSGDWMTADGVTVEIPAQDRPGASRVYLRGSSLMRLVPGLRVSATVPGHPSPLPVDFRVNGDEYSITVSLDGVPPGAGPLRVALGFSTHFVPQDVGISPDPRRLVLWEPKEWRVVYAAP